MEAGVSEIPLRRVGDSAFLSKRKRSWARLDLNDPRILPNKDFNEVHLVKVGERLMPIDEPPMDVMSTLNAAQQVASRRLWQRVPPHIRDDMCTLTSTRRYGGRKASTN